MLPVILLIVLFFALQLLVLFCCVAAGNDPYSQFLSDEEQVEYLARWKKEHGYKYSLIRKGKHHSFPYIGKYP